jgi:HD-like signal output (HDOD) protein
LAAEQLADDIGVNRSLAYTSGLLHGAGMIALDTWRQQQRLEFHFASVGLPDEATQSERAVLGFTHADVGAELLQVWEFPASIVEPVRWQHAPDRSRGEPLLSCLLHVAKWLRDASHLPDDLPLPPAPADWILETIGIGAASLETRLYRVREAFLEASKLLE